MYATIKVSTRRHENGRRDLRESECFTQGYQINDIPQIVDLKKINVKKTILKINIECQRLIKTRK